MVRRPLQHRPGVATGPATSPTNSRRADLVLWKCLLIVPQDLAESNLPRLARTIKDERSAMKNIFVGNLDFAATESAIRSLFEPHGAVERVTLVTDRDTGRSRGFAFVEMTNAEEADRAIAALNGTELEGRALNINEARPKREGGNRGSGGGFRGSRSGPRQRREPRW